MNLKIILIFLGLIAAICISYPVNAESGEISISDDKTLSYDVPNTGLVSGGAQSPYTTIDFDVANYNYIGNFRFSPSVTYGQEAESTSFTFSSCASGTGGWASYNKNLSYVKYVFYSDTVVTCSPIVLSFQKNIFANITGVGTTNNLDNPSSTKPVIVRNTEGAGRLHLVAYYTDVNVALRATDYYDVTYPISNYFRVNITKNPSVSSKYFITSATTTYSQETTFNKASIIGAMHEQLDGIYLNATLASGVYTKVLVNASGVPGYVPPGEEVVPDPITGVGIGFDAAEYSIGGIANISWIRTTNTPLLCTDYVRLTSPTNVKSTLVLSPPNTGYTKLPVSESGTYETSFERECFLAPMIKLDTDTAIVGAVSPSYIIPNATYYAGVVGNVTYFQDASKNDGLDIYYWSVDQNKYLFAGGYWDTVSGVEANYSFNCAQSTTYKFKLGDAVAYTKCVVDNRYPQYNITTSFLNVNTITPVLTDYLEVSYAVDSVNWTNNQTFIKVFDKNSIEIFSYPVVKQYSNLSFFLVPTKADFMDMVVGVGENTLKLITDDGFVLDEVVITISPINDQGYGLVFGKPVWCNNEKITFTYYSIDDSNISLWDSSGEIVYAKFLNASPTGKTTSIIYKVVGSYDVRLTDIYGLQKANAIITIQDCIAVPTPTWTGNGTWTPTQDNIASTCGFWDGCVRTMFMQQGVNDVTRLLFALFCIGVVMFFGMIASKGNFGVSICLGLIPYAFFAYLTISSPCGQYMPLWVTIFMALVIGIKMRWFS